VAQAIGRLGNWFNQELFGRPTTLPWALQIAPQYRPPGYEQFATFHPTFLYEMLWDLTAAAVLVWLDRRFRLGHGKVFALYVLLYTAGRFWIEALRIDTVNEIGGFRLNNYTALIGFIVALVWLIWLIRNRPGREEVVEGIGLPRVESVEETDIVDSDVPETAAVADPADRARAASATADDEETAGQASTKDPTVTP
jgi:prolipoprotein diacylglyceryltransferase